MSSSLFENGGTVTETPVNAPLAAGKQPMRCFMPHA